MSPSTATRTVEEFHGVCPDCSEHRLKSTVRGGGVTTTLMNGDSYWDENGDRHYHDPNSTLRHYACSNGHNFCTVTRPKCPVAGCHYGS